MATPTLTLLTAGANENNVVGLTAPVTITHQFQEPVLAGSLLLAYIVTNTGGTMGASAVTDDQSQTWTQFNTTQVPNTGVGGGNGNGFLFKMENTAANVRKVTFVVGAVSDFINVVLVQVKNVLTSAATGKTWGKESTSAVTSWDAGTAQTPTAGSSIYQFSTATVAQWLSAGNSTADTGRGYQMECDDLPQGNCVAQSWEGVTATSHSPTLTVNTAASYITIAVEVFSGSSGSDYSGIYCKRLCSANYGTNIGTTTIQYHMPTDGNLILFDSSSGNGSVDISSISGDSYTQHPNSPLHNGVGGSIQHYHADNLTGSRTAHNGTITHSADPSNVAGTVTFRDIVNADPSPLDTTTSATGTQSVAGNLQPLTVSPSAGNRYCGVYLDHNSGSEIDVNSTADGQFLLSYAGQDGTCTSHYCMDSGMAAKRITAGTYAPTFKRAATKANEWEALGYSYKEVSAGDTLFAQSIF